ncbi:sugar transporter [Actibacterium sp. MT2.3-13A]|uniref:sugar transporter n=1 Tax=Actibacterium sp. MT2.3-13A TaxID=2828332 RepID=UPI0032C23476
MIEIKPLAQPASMKRRHWGIMFSFLVLVLAPLAAAAIYLWGVSSDQYVSRTGFTVRQEEGGSATELLGGLAQFAGGGGSSDSSILYEFIQSQEIVEAIDDRLDLVALYSEKWPEDPLFALWPSASIEDLLWYWRRLVRVSYDEGSGLVDVRVRGFSPEVARRVAQEIVAESQNMINEINAAARDDLIRYARADLAEAVSRLKTARQALTEFRTRTQIVDPEADIQGQMGVINNLQQQLAEALVEFDLLTGSSNPGDPRVTQAQRRIDVIRERLAVERQAFARGEVAGIGADYPTLISEYEGLIVDREYAEEAYRAALAALDIAREKASRQSRYLATYIRPTLAQSSEYPQRLVMFGLAALFLVMVWGILVLVYYSIRDRG